MIALFRGFFMSPFATKIRQLITHYKRILKRHLSASHYALKINNLQIKRKDMKFLNDSAHYQIAHRILTDTEHWLANQNISASEHSGLEEFRHHLKDFLKDFHLANDKVVNSNQQASRIIVESIQLLCTPLSDKSYNKLKTNIMLLKTLGYDEELNKLNTALIKQNAEMNNQFLPLLQYLQGVRYQFHVSNSDV